MHFSFVFFGHIFDSLVVISVECVCNLLLLSRTWTLLVWHIETSLHTSKPPSFFPVYSFFLTSSLLPGVLLADGDVLQDVLGGAHGHGRPLVDAVGLDVQERLEAGGGQAARLLHNEGHGVAFV